MSLNPPIDSYSSQLNAGSADWQNDSGNDYQDSNQQSANYGEDTQESSPGIGSNGGLLNDISDQQNDSYRLKENLNGDDQNGYQNIDSNNVK